MRIVPQERQGSWDTQKSLAFTPPASLSSANRSRRVSQGLPGGGAYKLTQPDDSALRLPPLTPPGLEGSNPPAPSPLPGASPHFSNLGPVTPAPCRSASPFPLSSHLAAAGLLTPVPSAVAEHEWPSTSSSWDAHQLPMQQGRALKSPPPLPSAADNTAVNGQLFINGGTACSGRGQAEGKTSTAPVQQQEKQQQAGAKPCAASSSGQSSGQTGGQQARRQLNAAGADDTGQLGPPITRMRPAVGAAPSNSPAGKKGSSREAAAADTLQAAADVILLDAFLCGWEQQSNDGVSCTACKLLRPDAA